jgi:hypothetical protein
VAWSNGLMRRIGSLLVGLTLAATLAGCATAPTPDPTGDPVTCPDGLPSALEAHLAPIPLGDRVPDDVRVQPFPDESRFADDVVAGLVGCVFTVELVFDDARHFQIFGVSDEPEAEIVGALDADGWTQPDPVGSPLVWQSPGGSSLTLYRRGLEPVPALGFTEWADYLASGETLILATMDF